MFNAILVTLVLSILTPLVSKFATHNSASAEVKSALAVVVAALGAVAAWATSIPGVTTWKALAVVSAGALAIATLQRWTWLEPYVAIVERLFPRWLGWLPLPKMTAPSTASGPLDPGTAAVPTPPSGVTPAQF
jgi:hypothetical protein